MPETKLPGTGIKEYNTMEEFLGKKGRRGNALDIAAFCIFGVIAYIGSDLLADDVIAGKSAESIWYDLFIILLCLWGVACAILRIRDRAAAHKIAQYFHDSSDPFIYEDKLGKELMMFKPSHRVLKLQSKKYLQGINFDPQARCFFIIDRQSVSRVAAN